MIWIVLVALVGAGWAWSPARVSVSMASILPLALVALAAAAAVRLVGRTRPDRRPWDRVSCGIAAVVAAYASLYPLFCCSIYLAPLTGPFADRWLGTPEWAIGVDGYTARMWLDAHQLGAMTRWIYDASPFAVLVTAAASAPDRLLRFPRAFATASVAGLPLYLALPAIGPGAYAHHHPAAWVAPLLAARAGACELGVVGLVSCPSYHVVLAVLLACVLWPTRVRWFAVAWAMALIGSAWAIGEHYLIDLGVGLAVALWAWRRS